MTFFELLTVKNRLAQSLSIIGLTFSLCSCASRPESAESVISPQSGQSALISACPATPAETARPVETPACVAEPNAPPPAPNVPPPAGEAATIGTPAQESPTQVALTQEPAIQESQIPVSGDQKSETQAGEAVQGGEGSAETIAAPEKIGEAATIPIVEPKKVEPRKEPVEPPVRVLILGNAQSIKVRSEGELVVSFGDELMRLQPGSSIQFKPRSARVSVRMYPVGVATFTASEYEKAMEYAEKWREDGYTVRVMKAGGPIVRPDGTTADTTVYWVALGSFKEKKTAQEFRQKLLDRGVSCWVIDESVIAPRANIELVDETGNPRAYADSRVIIGSKAPIKIANVPFGTGFWSSGNFEDRSYLSPLEIIADEKGTLAAINEVTLEEYVKGIVPVEIRLSAPDEALKAQAVAARTEAMAKLGIQHAFDPYDFCASQHCQEFGGLQRRTVRTDAAADATRGEALMSGGSLIDAVYSANCGGHTENNDSVWSSRPNAALRGVAELYSNPDRFQFPLTQSQLSKWLKQTPRSYCGDPRTGDMGNFRWKVKYTAAEMTEIANKSLNVGTVKDIRVLRRGVSGRALCVQVVGSRNTVTVTKELEIRRVLGKLKSSMFIVEVKRSGGKPVSFTFYGGGWGHGVGMCQAGAEGMGLRGFNYHEILKHYFSGAEIKKLYD
ncbi:SpoIID/LytB domain-containing protein [Candidatus Poribacteria bacterium]|nr:SpoIID/LytB domain-containing protein [Candidatus Poribacteria bacterium]